MLRMLCTSARSFACSPFPSSSSLLSLLMLSLVLLLLRPLGFKALVSLFPSAPLLDGCSASADAAVEIGDPPVMSIISCWLTSETAEFDCCCLADALSRPGKALRGLPKVVGEANEEEDEDEEDTTATGAG